MFRRRGATFDFTCFEIQASPCPHPQPVTHPPLSFSSIAPRLRLNLLLPGPGLLFRHYPLIVSLHLYRPPPSRHRPALADPFFPLRPLPTNPCLVTTGAQASVWTRVIGHRHMSDHSPALCGPMLLTCLHSSSGRSPFLRRPGGTRRSRTSRTRRPWSGRWAAPPAPRAPCSPFRAPLCEHSGCGWAHPEGISPMQIRDTAFAVATPSF
jgi:hypothetical protein